MRLSSHAGMLVKMISDLWNKVKAGWSKSPNNTLFPSIFMTGVHPPAPHPKSPM